MLICPGVHVAAADSPFPEFHSTSLMLLLKALSAQKFH